MSTILPVGLAPSAAALAMPSQASGLLSLVASLSRDSAIPDLPATSASVNQLQSLAASAGASSGSSAALAAMPAPALPPPQLQPPQSTDPLKQDYFTDGDAGDSGSAPVI
jgi:hypothetical protein